MNVRNRKCIRKLSLRSLRAARKRNIIAVIAIALTALLFTSMFTIAASINSSYQTYTFRRIGGYCHGTFKDVTQEQAQRIATHRKIKAVGERMIIGISDSDQFAREPAEISYMDENCTRWSYALPSVGHMPQAPDEITMDTKTLALLGIAPEPGAKITLTYNVTGREQTVFPRTDEFTLVGWWEYDELSPVHYINISRQYADRMAAECAVAGAEPFRTDLNVMLPSELDIRGQLERVDEDLGYTWEENRENTVRIGANWGYTASSLSDSMDFGTVAVIVMLLILVVFTGYLIIYTIFRISVSEDIRCYGLLKTIGTTPRQLRRIIRDQALCLCAVGIPVGLLLGYGAGAALTPAVLARTTLGAGVSTISASPVIFIASALFALVTVLLSCSRPGRLVSKVSPVEAAKYTETPDIKRKRRAARGAKVHQMAFADLGRSRSRTALIIVSLALSVVLLNVLASFTGGFDMEKYLSAQTCADFIVGSTDYFRAAVDSGKTISQAQVDEIRANTSASVSGCGYTISGSVVGWMPEALWLADMERFVTPEEAKETMATEARRGDLVSQTALIEGLDEALFGKLTVVEGDLAPMFAEGSNAVAVVVDVDDYGNVYDLESCPAIGAEIPVTYTDGIRYIDSRTGEEWTEDTPPECMERQVLNGREADYRVCAYVEVPHSMGFRYLTTGYRLLLPAERLNADSGGAARPMFYAFDAANAEAEAGAERYVSAYTDGNDLMYESKATLRDDFEGFQRMFLLLGGILCAIIGLIGILNFFNAIMAGILSRRREFAVLQSVGMTNRQLRSMLIYEGMFYTMGSAAAALILSLVILPLSGRLFEELFWFYSARFTIVPVLIVIPAFALLGWLIPSLIFGQSMKESIIERLRSDE